METSDFIIHTTTFPFTESTTTSETTETTETTTTDVTTTTDADEQATTETTAQLDADELSGSWNVSGGEKNRIFDFYADGTGGRVDMGETSLGFTCSINGNVITFHFAAEDTESESGIIERVSDDCFEMH